MKDEDHDLLIEINANVKNMITNHTQHLIDDAKHFTFSDSAIKEIGDTVKNLQRDRWIQYGIFLAMITAAKIIFKV